MKLKRTASLLVALVLVILPLFSLNVTAASDQPASYSTTANSGERDVVCTTLSGTTASSYYTGSYTYDALSGLSQSDLLTTLRTLMKSTHKKQTTYNNCRDYANKTDCENADGTTIVTLYTSYESNYGEYNGGNGWNREHVWPKSLGGFDKEGAGADLHHIRPSENRTNSQRGNLKYGNVSGGSSSAGNMSGLSGGNYSGSYFEPLDNVKGDVARICLYVYVRWGGEYSKCSSITNVFQSVDVLLEWCALDPVDTWEMGRNEVVAKIQGNRNVFIDYPELAWQLFGREAPADMVTPSGEAADGTTPPVGSDTVKPDDTTVKPDDTTVKPDDTTVKPDDTTAPGCSHAETEISKKKDPTCGKDGYTGDVYCRACEALVEEGRVIPATGEHSFGEWKTVISAGPGTVGSKKHECEICHTEETATIPAMPAPMGTLPDDGITTQPSADAPSDESDSGGGCGGFTVASSLIALICAAGAAIIIKRK